MNAYDLLIRIDDYKFLEKVHNAKNDCIKVFAGIEKLSLVAQTEFNSSLHDVQQCLLNFSQSLTKDNVGL